MPMIQPRQSKTMEVRVIMRLWAENAEALAAYATMIAEPESYVLNALVETLARDKDFVKWRESHTGPFRKQMSGHREGKAADGGSAPPQNLKTAGLRPAV
ncbi:MAG: hypothetical protein ABJA98_27835 [Acidobacteriota bacterium]